ncbi:hypothetical protein HK101_003724 [Irineochytrium annulatum]|nr:hypothetical protein HK101_003724 [Irineochytrium annulatum]
MAGAKAAPMGPKGPPQTLVDSKIVAVSSLHANIPIEWHGYSYPFVPMYFLVSYVYLFEYDRLLGSKEFASLIVILALALHALVFLTCQWSINIRAWLTCRSVTDSYKADLIKIIPIAHHGAGAMCEIKKSTEMKSADGQPQLYFFFQKRKYIYDVDKKKFTNLHFPYMDGNSMYYYSTSKGLTTGHEIKELTDMYGLNRFDIPLPAFMELFKEHLVAPFFVFQLFCVLLWFLDDMWYYSLFTLMMLFVFESTVVFQRLKNLQEFRSMSIKPFPILVYRMKSWQTVQTDELLPGDLCSVVRSKEECPVPADMIVVDGSCIANEAMLSGESTPQLKESCGVRDEDDVFDVATCKNNMLFGGTKVLQVSAPDANARLHTPDGGCLCYVLRTGFSTEQGDLVRTIIYSTERVTANNLESLLFILFLLVFAVAAAAYVWIEGTKNEERKRSKVLLDCILIITSVVPPELPMELSLAVNNSLIALARGYVFCTEPFRIPFAGKVDVACFDKTGTLTTENLIVEGVTGLDEENRTRLRRMADLPKETSLVLAAAHALVMLEDGVIGDPMEKNTLESLGWTVSRDEVVTPKEGGKGLSIKILRRFPFSSALKRMSTLSLVTEGSTSKMYVAVKGAPETLRSMYKNIPEGYDWIYKHWAMRGSRVLALGYKVLEGKKPADAREIHRDQVESQLLFAGFLIFGCPLKPDSAKACVMITGDNALTACHVATEVDIIENPALIGDVRDNEFSWQTVDDSQTFPMNLETTKFPSELKKFDLCVTGKGLATIFHTPSFDVLLPRIRVYARVSPSQKEDILTAFKLAGYSTLMCGDGTNDVGALKQAHVGIALLDGKQEDMDKLNRIMMERRKKMVLEQTKKMRERMGLPPLPEHQDGAGTGGAAGQVAVQQNSVAVGPKSAADKRKEALGKQMEAMHEMMGEMEGDVPVIKFGDASVAAPFTSKLSTVMSVCTIVRQGRSTLVAMIQMYKILALNCLISAYSMSVMYLAGIKQGDWQATIGGLMITVCFFGIAKSTALETLSAKRPQTNVFNTYLILSVLGQVAIHVASLIYIRSQVIIYAEDWDEEINLDAEFKPNLLNSAVYLVSLIMQISTFAINYQGEPFRESLVKNKSLYNSLVGVGFIAVAAASEVSEALNDWMQLVPFPGDFRYKLMGTMAFDFIGAWIIEMIALTLFSNNKPKAALQMAIVMIFAELVG